MVFRSLQVIKKIPELAPERVLISATSSEFRKLLSEYGRDRLRMTFFLTGQ
jgi:hypothetical protein